MSAALIFLHGSGAGSEVWRHQVARFPCARTPDLPGHPRGEPCPTVAGYARWLRGELAGDAAGDVVLVGHSLGGAIALRFALDHPDALAGIVTIGSGARLRVHPEVLEHLAAGAADLAFFEQFLAGVHAQLAPGLATTLLAKARENGPAVLLNDLRACDGFDVMGRLGELRVPLLAICGDADALTPPKYSRFLAEAAPAGRMVLVPGGTHMVFAERPEPVNAAIASFLAELGSGDARD